MHETLVQVKKVGSRVVVVKDEGAAGGQQHGRKIALTLSSDQVDLSEEV
jgi:molybdopterin-containing oxidoreductase family iron-sulfur binding subunit